jgi:WD40 repeat protein
VTAIKAHYVDQDETLVISAGLDGTVRLWNANTIDQILEFHVPRREALSIDIHRDTFKCVCGFSDGNLRFFDYGRNINYGGVQLYTEPETKDKNEKNKVYPVSAVCFLGHENTILAGNMNGEVYMIYVQSWENMRVEVRLLVQNAGFAINHLAVSEVEPWDTWLLGTKNRKVMVWNRKDLNFNAKKDIEYYKRLFTKINELEYYLIDNYKIHQKGEKEGNFDDLKQEIDPHNKVDHIEIF